MKQLQSLRVSTRLTLLSGVALLGLMIAMIFLVIHNRDSRFVEKQIKTRNLVEVAYSTVEHFHRLEVAGKLNRAEAQTQAGDAVRALRYEQNEYFWINDMAPKVIVHGAKPELEGKDMSTLKDANGKLLFVEFVAVVRRDGAGFVDYLWPKPGADKAQPKTSYVRGFAPWGWIVGSGIYTDDVAAEFREDLLEVGTVMLLLLAVLAVLSWLIGRSVLLQLGGEPAYAAEVTRRIANGNLAQRVEVQGDESSLLGALRGMQDKLSAVFQDINQSARRLNENAERMAAAARESSATGQRQSEATAATAAAIEEVTVSINEVSSRARETAQRSKSVAELSDRGRQQVAEAEGEVRHVSSSVGAASGKVQELLRRSGEIGNIANVIKEIADQTNLLALNAAIEAARAGEQGRGFSVVADEVRKLAERTANATTEISGLISTVQGDTREAVSEMEQMIPLVNRSMELARGANETLQEIHRLAGDSLDSVEEVAHATSEQAAATTDIARNVEHIAQAAEQFNTTMQNTAGQAEELEGIATQLRQRVAYFRLET